MYLYNINVQKVIVIKCRDGKKKAKGRCHCGGSGENATVVLCMGGREGDL